MPGNAGPDQRDTSQSPSSWTRRLSQKLTRRADGENVKDKKPRSSEQASPSVNPFARDYATPGAYESMRNSTSMDQTRSGFGTTGSNAAGDPWPTRAANITTPRASTEHANARSTSDESSTSNSPMAASIQSTVLPSPTERDDDIIGLDMKGRPRRRSALGKKPVTPDRHDVPPNPFARSSDSTPFQRLLRRSIDKSSEAGPSGTSAYVASSPAAGPMPTGSSSGNRQMADGASLPIFSEFKNSGTQTQPASGQDITKTLGKASALLKGNSAVTTDAEIDQLGNNVNRLAFHSPEILSPESFASAQNYFESKSGRKCEDIKDQTHPSAEEIIDRAKWSSVDTTRHERMAPAVTHETIKPQVHEIIQKDITRDVHHYHNVHRLLPVHEVEILPAKHYRVVNGMQVEIAPEQVPQSRVDAWESAIIPKIQA